MDKVRYIHAADLHLDSPFQGLSDERGRGDDRLAKGLRDSTFRALDNLAALCAAEKPDFLVLAGDLHNQEEASVRARLALLEFCRKLDELNIPVFIIHGNHDPLPSRYESIQWPDNTTFFGPEPEKKIVEKNGRPIAVIHGASIQRARDDRNLARLMTRSGEDDCFQLGLLHCTVDNDQDPYVCAPCALEDLRAAGLDAWALGHVHNSVILSGKPFVAYSGNVQGLAPGETGPRGCLAVTASRDSGGWLCESVFHRLGDIEMAFCEADLGAAQNLDEAGHILESSVARLRDDAGSDVLASVKVKGWDAVISPEARASLLSRLASFAQGSPAVWIRDLEPVPPSPESLEDLLERQDLLGETAREANLMLNDEGAMATFAKGALAPLFDNPRFGRILDALEPGEIRGLLLEAQALCRQELEKS